MDKNTPEAAASDFISPKVTPPAVMQAFVEQALKADPVLADLKNDGEFNVLQAGRRDRADARALRRARSGRACRTTPASSSRASARRDKQMVVLPGADHAAQLEDTHDAWIAAVVNFLNRPPVRR